MLKRMKMNRKLREFGIRVILLLFAISFLVLFCHIGRWICVKKQPFIIYRSQREIRMELESLIQSLLVQDKSSGCKMPILDPFSPEITRFDTDVKAVACDGDDWVECHLSKCYVKKRILNRLMDVMCTYKDIIYVNDDNYLLGKAIGVKNGNTFWLNISDYVKVSCTGIEANSSRLLRWEGRKAGFRPLDTPVIANVTALNVFLLIIDSTSKNTFIRRMPISYKVLVKELGAVIMNGYNIVGESTPGAMWPILTGHNEYEVSDSFKRPTNTKRVDTKPFLFKLLHKYGFRTAFFEDMPWFHTFNYRFNGFDEMPADHYMRLLFQEIGWSNQEKNWTDKNRYCFGSESMFKFMMDYSAEVFKTSGKKFIVTLSGTFTHNDINAITLADEDVANFLRRFKREGHLSDTMLFVMGDHGSRVSALRNTYQGRIEEYLPFVSVVLPKRLKQTHPKALSNLLANSKALTTPFDVHTTILDALGLKNYRNKYKVIGASFERGMSFLEPIPESRSCGEAGIMPHFCACAKWLSVSANENAYTMVAKELARFINRVTAENRHICAIRELLAIAEMYRLDTMIDLVESTTELNTSTRHVSTRSHQNRHLRLRANLEYYQAKIIMDPREAIFEGSVLYNVKEGSFTILQRDISRIDRYGNEPWCVSRTQPHLNKFCYCLEK